MCSCASRYCVDHPIADARTIIESGVEWTRVHSIAQWHGVVPLLHAALVESGVIDIPDDAACAIRNDFLRQTADSLLYARELARTMTALETNGVRAVAFKGPALAVRLYGKASFRRCRDLDLLIARDDLPNALKVLHSHGYERSVSNGVDDRILFRTEKDCLLVHQPSMFKVELHWAVATPSFYFRTPFDEIWQRRKYVSVLDTPVAIPHPEDLLLLLSVHGTRHCWASLKWICDIAEVVRQCPDIDWLRVCERARKLGCRRMLLIGITLARDSLGTTLPAVIERELERDRAVEPISANLHARLLRRTEPWFHYERTVLYVRSHERWYDRVRMVAGYVAANLRPDERDREFIRLPRGLGLLYWPIRIVRVFCRHWRHAGVPLLASLAYKSIPKKRDQADANSAAGDWKQTFAG